MNTIFSKHIKSLRETDSLIDQMLPYLKSGISLGLCGDLGAGKTTFTKMLVKKLGSEDEVSSPTYVLQHEYRINDLLIEHWDLYRLKSLPNELNEPQAPGTLRIIEWADKFPELLETINMLLKIEVLDHDHRVFHFLTK